MLWFIVCLIIGVISIIGIILSCILWLTDWADWCQPISIIALVAVILSTALFGVARWDAAVSVVAYEETRQMVVQCVENGSDMENIGITHAVIERKQWLAEAKSSLKVYGMWSMYYGLGIEEMNYIELGGN